jgi:predicted nucleic acid-binding protein
VESLVNAVVELPLDQRIAERAIELRRQKKRSLADAIIAATALVYEMPLVTRNERDFSHVGNLEIVNPFQKP